MGFKLTGVLRTDEKLRNRYFPGFRISAAAPTPQQIIMAFRNEILQKGNSRLANCLCEVWIKNNCDLADTALQSLGIEYKNASEVSVWLENVHSALAKENAPERASFHAVSNFMNGLRRGLAQTLKSARSVIMAASDAPGNA